jgi:hypothetical protein
MLRAVLDLETILTDLGQADLGHKSRVKRLVHTARLLGQGAAGRSLPDRLPNRPDYEGALNLANNPAVSHPAILASHFRATRQRMLDCPGVVLNISDTTYLDLSGLKVAFLGPIGNGHGKGIVCHNSLAVDISNGDVLGLTSQILHCHDSDVQIEAERQARAAKSPTTPPDKNCPSDQPANDATATPQPQPKPKRRRRRAPNTPSDNTTPKSDSQPKQAADNSTVTPVTSDVTPTTSNTTPTPDSQAKQADDNTIVTPVTSDPGHQPKKRRRPDEPAADRHKRASRETRLWVEGSAALGDVPEGKLWVDVCDRAADTWEYLCHMAGRLRKYVIRSKHNRVVDNEGGTETQEDIEEVLELEVETEDGEPKRFHEVLRGLKGVMSWQVEVAENKDQTARTATVQMAWVKVKIMAPKSYQGKEKDPLDVWAIRVWEPNPPTGTKRPLEWFLLTNVQVETNEQARERVSWYEWRPVVEEYNKAQKTGMGIEDLQLQSRKGLEVMIGLLSVVALVLLNIRQIARREEAATTRASEVVNPVWVKVLSMLLYKEERDLSVREFYFGVARLGGYFNRRRGAWPGWIVLWRGFTKLLHVVSYELASSQRTQRSRESPEF